MFLEKLLGKNTLYYPGCLTKFVYNNLKENYEKIMKKIGIRFIEIDELVCCGSPVKNAGYIQQFKMLARKNYEILKRYNVGKILFNCPACCFVFKKEYPKLFADWSIECEHLVQTIWNAVESKRLNLIRNGKGIVTYHDPCYLGRYLGIYEEPRKLIEYLGYKLIEMEENKDRSLCCGGGGGLRANYPQLSKEIAKDRIKQALDIKAKILVSSCPMCVATLSQFKKIKVLDISELIIKHLR